MFVAEGGCFGRDYTSHTYYTSFGRITPTNYPTSANPDNFHKVVCDREFAALYPERKELLASSLTTLQIVIVVLSKGCDLPQTLFDESRLRVQTQPSTVKPPRHKAPPTQPSYAKILSNYSMTCLFLHQTHRTSKPRQYENVPHTHNSDCQSRQSRNAIKIFGAGKNIRTLPRQKGS